MWQVAPQVTRRIPKGGLGLGAVAAFGAGMVHIFSSCARIQDVERELFFLEVLPDRILQSSFRALEACQWKY